jgi:polyvinyl alcohol dehydrogenase (cytochrome)
VESKEEMSGMQRVAPVLRWLACSLAACSLALGGTAHVAAADSGAQIYSTICARCHEEGIGHAPQRALFVFMSPQSVYRALSAGLMQAQAQGLSDGDKIAVAQFVTHQTMNAAARAPEPPACTGKAAHFDDSEPPIFPGWGLASGNTRLIAANLAGINRTNVGRLQLKWAVAFPDASQVRSEPALALGALFVGSHNGEVYALDRLSGCARWIYQAGVEVRTGIVVSSWKAGDRAANPLVYFGDIVGNIYALDARSGRLVWRTRADENPYITIAGTPTLDADTLYVPVSSLEGMRPPDPNYACCTSRGEVVAYNAASGEVKWRTYTTDTPQLIGTNAAGAKQYAPSGAPIWNSPTIDTRRKQLYVATGNTYTSPSTDKDDAIIAMDLATGAVKWVYQGLTGDATNLACVSPDKTNCPRQNGPDLDFGASAILATMSNGRQLVIGGQKSGDVYALDPDTGKLAWRVKPGRGGGVGGVHFGLASNNDAVFVPINDTQDPPWNAEPFTEPAHPGIYAFDLGTGKAVWSAPSNPDACVGLKVCRIGYSQAITATPDLIFAGSGTGWLRVFDAKSGTVLWQIDTKAAFKTVTGEDQTGGAFGGGAGPVLYHGMLFASSGYSLGGQSPSNLLLAFEIK